MYILDFGDIVFTDENIKDKIEYLQQINPDGDLTLGVAAMAELKFTLYDLAGIISDTDIAGREFVFKKAKISEYNSRWDVFKRTKPALMCLHGDTVYSVKNKVFYIDNVPASTQPTEPIKCIMIVNDKVYLGHTDSVDVYSLAGIKQSNIMLTPFQKTQIVQGRSLNMQGDTLNEYTTQLYNLRPNDFIQKTSAFKQVGLFTALKPERRNSTSIAVSSYDRMNRFNKVIDSLLNSIAYPVTAFVLLQKVCELCQVQLAESEITNGNFPIDSNSTYTNTTGRNALKWIGELSNNFSYIDSIGKLHMRFYQPSNTEYLPENFKSVRIAEYSVAKIDNLQIKVEENDAGVCVGTGTNLYLILNNPFFYVTREETLRPYAQVLYDKVKGFQYTPCELETVLDNDFEADVGNIVLIKGVKTAIMSKRIKGLIETYSSSGNIDRRIKEDNLNYIVQRNIEKTKEVSDKTDEVSKDFDSVFEYKEEEDKFYLKEDVDISHASNSSVIIERMI